MKVKTATGILAAYMRLCGFKGWASFWKTIYTLPGWEHNSALIRHEMKHLEQIERHGIFWFAVTYAYYFIVHGYKNNPYEIEARAAE